MTINKQCLVKSLKTDYLNIGTITAIILMVGLVCYAAFWCANTYQNQVRDFLTALTQPFTAVNMFILVEICVMAICGYEISCDVFSHETSKRSLKESSTTLKIAVITSLLMILIWIGYNGMSAIRVLWKPTNPLLPPYPNVLLILIELILINVFIVCPVSVAIARCKE